MLKMYTCICLSFQCITVMKLRSILVENWNLVLVLHYRLKLNLSYLAVTLTLNVSMAGLSCGQEFNRVISDNDFVACDGKFCTTLLMAVIH